MLGTSRIPHAAVGACVALGALLGIPSAYGGPPRLDHVIVVILENHSYDQVRAKPYIASLMASGATFSGSYAVTHPSQPNYLALWSGGTQGISDDACPAPGSPFMAENLGHACERKGLTWKAYSENLPSAGSTACSANSGKYTRKHDPWTDFGNLNHQNERGYADLAADIGRGALPNLAFVVPNNCNNSHDCSVSTADGWLAGNVPAMLNAIGRAGVLIVTWDEDDKSASNHILTVMVGTPVKAGFVSTGRINHYGVLRMISESLGITPFGAAAGEASVSDVWNSPTPVAQSTWGRVKTLYRW